MRARPWQRNTRCMPYYLGFAARAFFPLAGGPGLQPAGSMDGRWPCRHPALRAESSLPSPARFGEYGRGASEVSSTTIVLDQGQPAPDGALGLVDAERLRIARELHDVVAYSFATISLQAGVGAHVADTRPDKAAEALRIIKEISGDASRELRAILGILRRADAGDGDPLGHGLAEIQSLAATTTDAGVPPRATASAPARSLPPALDRAAYRIVQEALTNALRHAGPATASNSLAYGPDR